MSKTDGTEKEEQFVMLETIAQGSAVELFNKELSTVINNILDPNTKAETTRSITLKVEIKPTENRGMGDVTVGVTSKLAPPKTARTTLFFGKKRGEGVATERDPNQMSFDDVSKPTAVPDISDKRK